MNGHPTLPPQRGLRWLTRLYDAVRFARARGPKAIPISNAASMLANSGLCILNGNAREMPTKTVIVLGLARGGTSMIAGVLKKLGIYMGETRPPLYEDQVLGAMIESGNHRAAGMVIQERNLRYETWGFKNPARQLLARRWRKQFRLPVYVIVFRDVVAIAQRRAVSRQKDLFGEIVILLKRYLEIIEFLKRTRRPALLVSYEKALVNPAEFVRQLADFLGVDDAAAAAAAVAIIRPSPESYRKVARYRAEWAGYLDVVEIDHIAGWAFRTGRSQPVRVRLSINSDAELTAVADIPRTDVQQRYRHVTNLCGFAVRLPPALHLKPGDRVSVRIDGEDEEINNSPHHFV